MPGGGAANRRSSRVLLLQKLQRPITIIVQIGGADTGEEEAEEVRIHDGAVASGGGALILLVS